jgi:hypothetical protein
LLYIQELLAHVLRALPPFLAHISHFVTKARNKEPNLWVTVLKLAAGAAALAGLVWLALWYVDTYSASKPMAPPPLKPKMDWGIANDSPIRNNR